MNKEGLQKVVENAAAALNIPLTATADFSSQNSPVVVRIAGLNEQEAFSLVCQRSPMTWIVDVRYDLFAQLLINRLVQVAISHQNELADEVHVVEELGIVVDINLDDLRDAFSANSLDGQKLMLRLTSANLQDQGQIPIKFEVETLSSLISNSLILLSLLLSDFEKSSVPADEGDEEGELTRVFCNSYSRSARNRARCLEAHGYTCQACRLKPEDLYGPIGRRVIHVHHRTPVSMMENVSKVDPILDLVPLCPNCHNYAHKRNPPFSPEEIQTAISQNNHSEF